MATQIETPEAANRLARAIASDVSLYNEDKIKKGIEDDSFFTIIKDEIEEGREHFKSRVAPALHNRGIFERALCDVIIARKAHIKSRIW
jgi:hypothetical protein